MEHIIIIGGGGTGAALAHDLVLRGFRVSLFEKGELLSGTTGRHHGLLHSGARYVVHDPIAARECFQENQILRRIAPESIESNDGLFIALDEGDSEYSRNFLEKCRACDIPTRKLSPQQALALEPELNPALKMAVQVPDATMDAWRLPLQFFATAKAHGARIQNFTEVIDLNQTAGSLNGIRVCDHKTHREYDVNGDMVVNAAGAWAGKICGLAGIQLPIQPGPGVMVALHGRLTNMIVNRLHPAGQGDIIVPQRNLSILGTSIWLADDPESIDIPQEHISEMVTLCSRLVPAVKDASIRSAWQAVRPLIVQENGKSAQEISRAFDCYDHQQRDNLSGFVSIIGGKATTLRAMAEKTADLICRKIDRDLPCRTASYKLLPYRAYYKPKKVGSRFRVQGSKVKNK